MDLTGDVANLKFLASFCQDQLIQNAIWTFADPTLATIVAAAATTTKAAWGALHTAYSNKSKMRESSVCSIIWLIFPNSPFVSLIIYSKFIPSMKNLKPPWLLCLMHNSVKIITRLGSDFCELLAVVYARDQSCLTMKSSWNIMRLEHHIWPPLPLP